MNVKTNWASAYDGNTPIDGNTTMVRNGSFKIVCDVSISGSNACGTQMQGQQPHFDLTDWNATNSRMYVPIWIDDNSTVTSLEVYLGSNFTNTFNYRNSNPYLTGFYEGWMVVPFDLNTTIGITGTPNVADINYVLIRLVYGAGQADYNMHLNGIWLSRTPNEFNDAWRTLDIPGGGINAPQGYAMPFNWTGQGRGMSMRNNDKTSLGLHGRVFIPQFNSLDLSQYDIDFSMDVNQVDINQQTRMILTGLNFGGTDNFDGCYILRLTSTTAMLGVEEWQNGVKSFTQAQINHNLNDYNTMRCTIVDNNISVYMNGVIKASRTLVDRIDGYIGIEAYVGRQNIQNVTINLDLTNSNNDVPGSAGEHYPLLNTLIRLLAFPIVFLYLLFMFIQGELDIQETILAIIVSFLAFIVFNALFFQVPI